MDQLAIFTVLLVLAALFGYINVRFFKLPVTFTVVIFSILEQGPRVGKLILSVQKDKKPLV